MNIAFGIRWDSGKQIRTAIAFALAAAVCLGLVPAAHAKAHSVSVIVRERAGAGSGPERAVARLGGRVGRHLTFVQSFIARVPSDAVARLEARSDVASVTRDESLALASTTVPATLVPTTLASVRGTIGADKVGATGQGIDVAMIDSGVVPVPGLTDPGKIVNGPDFSTEADDPSLRYLDGFGHGTHLAGIIAGHNGSNGFAGVAPGARLVNVKVAASDGTTSISKVLWAIDWVIQNKNSGDLNIRVLNLSFGVENPGAYQTDPLAAAVEAVWQAGIVVVAAGGNAGASSGGLDSPATDPIVIAVGGTNTLGNTKITDDTVADWSSRGDAQRAPDVVAPGASIVSLRDPGSFIDMNFPEGRMPGGLFRGSGTSQATAVTSGEVADLLQQRPTLTPDQVKAIVSSGAINLAGADPLLAGNGEINVLDSVDDPAPAPAVVQPDDKEQKSGGHGKKPKKDKAGSEFLGPDGRNWQGGRWAAGRWAAGRWAAGRWAAGRWAGSGW